MTSTRQCTDFQISFLRAITIWETVTNDKIMKKIVEILSICTIGTLCLCFILEVVYIFTDELTPEKIAANLFVTVPFANSITKMYFFKKKKEIIFNLIDRINGDSFQVQTSAEERYLKKAIRISKFVSLFSIIYGTFVITTFFLIPYFEKKYIFPFTFWFPFETANGGYRYFVGYFFQLFGVLVGSFTQLGGDNFLCSTFIQQNLLIELLGERMSSIGSTFVKNQSNFNLDYYKDLVKCIQMHITIYEIINDFKRMFNVILYIQIVQSVVCFVMCTVQLFYTDPNSLLFWIYLIYSFSVFWETASFTWLGNNIVFAFKELPTNAYFSEFHTFNKRSSQALLLFMNAATAKELSIEAKGILTFKYNLQTFLTVLKTSYTYLAVMRNMS